MAFSTQSEFFHVPIINETIEFACRKDTVKVKSYESSADVRSWALSDGQQSRFLTELLRSRNTTLGLDFDTDELYNDHSLHESELSRFGTDRRNRRGQSELANAFRGERCSSIGPCFNERQSSEKEKKKVTKRSRSTKGESIKDGKSHKRSCTNKARDNVILSARSLKSGDQSEIGRGNKSDRSEKRGNGADKETKENNPGTKNHNKSACHSVQMTREQTVPDFNDGHTNIEPISRLKYSNSDTDKENLDSSRRFQSNENLVVPNVEDSQIVRTTRGKHNEVQTGNEEYVNSLYAEESESVYENTSPRERGRISRELGGFSRNFDESNVPSGSYKYDGAHCSKSPCPASCSNKNPTTLRESVPGTSPCFRNCNPGSAPKAYILGRLGPGGTAGEKKEYSSRGKEINIPKNMNVKADTSFIRVANTAMGRLEDILQEKKLLEEQLNYSNKCLSETTKECDELRKRLKAFKEMERKIAHLQAKAKDAGHVTGDIKENLCKQARYIEKMEDELIQTQNFYEEKIKAFMCNEQTLQRRSCSLKEELMRARSEAMKVEPLQKEIAELCYEIKTLQAALDEYDCQYKELIQVVEELQASHAQPQSADFIEDLAYFTSTTLLEIKKEMENRKICGIGDSKNVIEEHSLDQQTIQELQAEKSKLETTVVEVQKDCEKICAEALDKLKQLQIENEALRSSRDEALSKKEEIDTIFETHRKSIDNLRSKVGDLDKEFEETSKTASQMFETIEQSEELVQEIVKIREENEKLASTIDLIQKADSSHEIEDLNRKLQEALDNLEKCKQENNMLQENLKHANKLALNLNDKKDMDLAAEIHSNRLQGQGPDSGAESHRSKRHVTAYEDVDNVPRGPDEKKVRVEDDVEDIDEKTGRSGKASKRKLGKRKEKDRKNLNLVKNSGAYDEFVSQNALRMKSKVNFGSSFVRELRAILDAFIVECGFCFCKECIPKSRFYATCHKILHCGIQNVSFNDLVYMHRKLFKAIENIQPGWLLQSMLSDQLGPDGLKCCNCKNILCCTNSEEMLKEKVTKLEKDIEMAREYLENLKACPSNTHSINCHTYDGQEITPMQRNSSYSLKSRFNKSY